MTIAPAGQIPTGAIPYPSSKLPRNLHEPLPRPRGHCKPLQRSTALHNFPLQPGSMPQPAETHANHCGPPQIAASGCTGNTSPPLPNTPHYKHPTPERRALQTRRLPTPRLRKRYSPARAAAGRPLPAAPTPKRPVTTPARTRHRQKRKVPDRSGTFFAQRPCGRTHRITSRCSR